MNVFVLLLAFLFHLFVTFCEKFYFVFLFYFKNENYPKLYLYSAKYYLCSANISQLIIESLSFSACLIVWDQSIIYKCT